MKKKLLLVVFLETSVLGFMWGLFSVFFGYFSAWYPQISPSFKLLIPLCMGLVFTGALFKIICRCKLDYRSSDLEGRWHYLMNSLATVGLTAIMGSDFMQMALR